MTDDRLLVIQTLNCFQLFWGASNYSPWHKDDWSAVKGETIAPGNFGGGFSVGVDCMSLSLDLGRAILLFLSMGFIHKLIEELVNK